MRQEFNNTAQASITAEAKGDMKLICRRFIRILPSVTNVRGGSIKIRDDDNLVLISGA
jgi:hypothetical protein